jgi:hypothetical protein
MYQEGRRPADSASTFATVSTEPSSILHSVARHGTLIAILVVALALRVPGLGEWWLNPDEGIYYSILTRLQLSDFVAEVAENAHPPLYYLLLRGLRILTWDFVWLRGFSVACGVVAVAGVWAATNRLSGGGARGLVAALCSGLLVTFSSGAVELSRVMRPYMMLFAFLAWAFYFLLKELDATRGCSDDAQVGDGAGGSRGLTTYVVLVCLALLTHYSAIFAIGVFGALLLHEGVAHGLARPAWRRLALAHLVPGVLITLLWVFHLRAVSGSGLATEALDGWLGGYMITSPGGVWSSLLGFQRLAAPTWFRGPAAIALLGALVYAGARREWRLLVAGGTAIAIGVIAATLQLYPMGATRHSVWLMTFTLPLIGWFCASLLDVPRGARGTLGVLALILSTLFGGPLGSAIGIQRTPWAPDDLFLRRASLAQVMPLLSSDARPELVVVPEQAFYLLLPLWARERETATVSADGSAFHFQWGQRRVLVSRYWDFSAPAEEGSASVHRADGRFALHIGRFLESSNRSFPELGISDRDEALVAIGGWETAFVSQLKALRGDPPLIRAAREVPGLHAFVVDLGGITAALQFTREEDGARP